MTIGPHRTAAFLGALLASLLASSAMAQVARDSFEAEIGGSQKFTYDSNPLRVTTGEEAIYGSTTAPELLLRWRSPMTTIESKSRVAANFYDDSSFNSIDFNEDLLLKRENQRWTASLRGIFNRETTRNNDVTNYGINLPRVYNTVIGAAPEIRFRSTERDTWVLNGTANHSTYDDNAYVDFNFYALNPSYEHKFNAQNTGTIGFTVQRYDTLSGADLTSDSYGPNIGWVGLITPRLTLRANAGVLFTDQSGTGAGTENGWNYVFSGGAAYKGEQDTLDFTATRARQPFGNGTETLLDSFTLTERHKINRHLELNALARYQQADYDSPPGINLDSGYTLGSGISWRAWEQVALTVDYKYRSEELTNVSGEVDQHLVMLGVNYQPSWSGN